MSLRKKDALKVSDDIDAALDLKSEIASPVQDLGYKDLLKMISLAYLHHLEIYNYDLLEVGIDQLRV
jgi:hypothetical protein